MNNSKQKGIGLEYRRCSNCQNMQEVLTIDETVTLFFKCDKCNSHTFIHQSLFNPAWIIRTIDTT